MDSEFSRNRFGDPKLLERHRRFWHREEMDRPLVGVLVDRMFPLHSFQPSRDNATVVPSDVTEEWFTQECERRYRASQQTGGDALFVAYAGIGLPWIEGILGCEVRVQSGTGWAEPLSGEWKTFDGDSVQWTNGWFEKMQHLTHLAAQTGAGRYPVGPAHMRSPIDLAWTLVGAQQLCLSIYDQPAELGNLLDVLVAAWIKAVEAQFTLLPTYDGGYWNGNQPLWAPGKSMFITADAASVLSPKALGKFVLPDIARIVKGLDYSILHTHSSHQHIVDLAMDIEELRAIQVGIDDKGQQDAVSSLIPQFRKIQERKALIVGITEQDVDKAVLQARTVLGEISPRGLCILSYLPTAEDGMRFLTSLKDT
jgi:hypothetical protein